MSLLNTIQCPNCGYVIISDFKDGDTILCPECNSIFIFKEENE